MPRSPWLCALVLLCGCLRSNPAYEAGPTGEASTTGSTGEAPDTSSSSGGEDPTSTGDDTTIAAPTCDSDEVCNDGVYCNGDEYCAPGALEADAFGCAPGVSPCDPGTMCQEAGDVCLTVCEADADLDDDMVDSVDCGGTDCDDGDPAVFPGQTEVCDAAGVDEDCDPATLGPDGDGDGLVSDQCCNPGGDGLVCGEDCDDAQPGFGLGDWAHCGACDSPCDALESCVDATCVGARRVFVTSTVHTGDLGGLGGADSICQDRADAAQLAGAFKAYLVDNNDGLDRLEQPAVPFVRLDGVVVADDWADLTDESIDAPLDLDELREPQGDHAWTGLRDVDGGGVSSCTNWTYGGDGCLDGMPCGGASELGMVDDHWDGFYVYDCDENYHLICVEQG